MTELVVFDPGMSTGIVKGTFSDTEPFTPTHKYQITGGLPGLKEFLESPEGNEVVLFRLTGLSDGNPVITPTCIVVAEKFTPRAREDGGGLTLKSVEPLRIEGYLVGDDYIPDYDADRSRWRQPGELYFSGGHDKASRKKASQEWLKSFGLWTTGTEVGQRDADDVNSAMLHALGYMRDQFHGPSLAKYFRD